MGCPEGIGAYLGDLEDNDMANLASRNNTWCDLAVTKKEQDIQLSMGLDYDALKRMLIDPFSLGGSLPGRLLLAHLRVLPN